MLDHCKFCGKVVVWVLWVHGDVGKDVIGPPRPVRVHRDVYLHGVKASIFIFFILGQDCYFWGNISSVFVRSDDE